MAVLIAHRLDNSFNRRHVSAVAIENFVSQRQAFGRHHQANADLHAVRPRVARITVSRLGIGCADSLEVGRGDVVKQEIVSRAKEFAVGLSQVAKKSVLLRQQNIKGAIETIVIDLVGRHAEQVVKGGLAIPEIGDLQLRRRRAKSRQSQNAGHHRPGDFLATGLHGVVEETIQPQSPPKRQPEIHLAETS